VTTPRLVTTMVTLRIPTTLIKSLAKMAKDRKTTRSTLIREFIADALADNGYYSS
jgi:metal-responsive CopG/Arc/MetJ family transcriptional regulator